MRFSKPAITRSLGDEPMVTLDASALNAHINLQEIAEDDFARAARDTLERLAAGAHARRALAQRIAARAGAAGHDAGGRA